MLKAEQELFLTETIYNCNVGYLTSTIFNMEWCGSLLNYQLMPFV